MRTYLQRRTLLGPLLAVSLTTMTAPLQTEAQEARDVPADTHDDNGFDEGLLGLLGLAGLLGLRRRDRTDVNTRARTDRL